MSATLFKPEYVKSHVNQHASVKEQLLYLKT